MGEESGSVGRQHQREMMDWADLKKSIRRFRSGKILARSPIATKTIGTVQPNRPLKYSSSNDAPEQIQSSNGSAEDRSWTSFTHLLTTSFD